MITVILNDAPYGTERSYYGLRLTLFQAKSNEEARVFLLTDAAFCGMKKQQTPNGY